MLLSDYFVLGKEKNTIKPSKAFLSSYQLNKTNLNQTRQTSPVQSTLSHKNGRHRPADRILAAA